MADSAPRIPPVARAAVLPEPRARVEIRERPVPEPGHGQVLLRVRACGVCHSEVNLVRGGYPFASYPTVPGHEIAAEVAAQGPGVDWPALGARVGLPFLYSSCGHCHLCARGDGVLCQGKEVTGISVEGGYQEYMLAPAASVTPLPDEIDDLHAAPLMCAGLTAFNGLRRAGLEPGDRVAVIGTGGVGHLALRFARAMGGRVCAVARSAADVEDVPADLAERVIVHDDTDDLGAALRDWEGGADLVLSTAPVTAVANAAFSGLAPDGTLMLVGYDKDPVTIEPLPLLLGRTRVMGSPSGSPKDLRDTLAFAAAHDIRPVVTPIALDGAGDALDAMERGEMRGRTVISFDPQTANPTKDS